MARALQEDLDRRQETRQALAEHGLTDTDQFDHRLNGTPHVHHGRPTNDRTLCARPQRLEVDEMRIGNIFKSIRPSVGRSNETTRERWLEEALSSIPKNSKILDAGAGTQCYRKFCKHLEYVSQDFGKYDGQGDAAGLQTREFDYGKLDIVSDITSIPRPDSSFDAIMCIEVLEHLPDPVRAVKEFSRLIKPNGHLVLTAPFCSLTHFAPYHFSTGLNKYWYEKHLKENGFRTIEIAPNGNFFEYVGQEVRRIRSVSRRFSQSKPNLLESVGIYFTQRMLSRFSKRDNGSSELLCFGYHIYARKV